jgi:phosphopantothenoylcysteine decarboxylase / phosphopantothenate---cysteine ligase
MSTCTSIRLPVKNLEKLAAYGNQLIEAPYGELASGLSGEGRMTEPEELLRILQEHFKKKDDFRGFNILITAGPTHEKIDPVRFISNYSSGKMGYALAAELARRGATVNLVSGPVHLKVNDARMNTIPVSSAMEMFTKCLELYETADIAIFSAAVADFRPANPATRKIKKSTGSPTARFWRKILILPVNWVGKKKKTDQCRICA